MAIEAHTPAAAKRFKAHCHELNLPCHICRQPIDYNAPAFTPNAFELDHYYPRVSHPELTHDEDNFRPSHHSCNRARGTKPLDDVVIDLGNQSRMW